MKRLSMSRIRMARAPSANTTGMPPGVATATLACLTRASSTSRSRTRSTQRSRARILDPQVDRLVIDVLDFHQLDARPGAGHARGLMAFLRALNIEHREEPRVGVVVRPFTRRGQRRHLHPEHVVIEREGPVHVLHERRERAGTDDRAGGRRRLPGGRRVVETQTGPPRPRLQSGLRRIRFMGGYVTAGLKAGSSCSAPHARFYRLLTAGSFPSSGIISPTPGRNHGSTPHGYW